MENLYEALPGKRRLRATPPQRPASFPFVVTPEHAAEITDLRALTRELAVQMESDLGARLDWVGIAH
jgi:type IV secretory pathway VirD2 relaxase